MNNAVFRKIDLTASYAPLSDKSERYSFTLTASPGNVAAAYVEGDTGDDVPIQPGEWHAFRAVDLNEVRVKGSAGDTLTVIGGTW